MFDAAAGLTEVTIDDLKKLLRVLHREEIRCPVTVDELARCGLQHCADSVLNSVRGLDAVGVKAVVVAVIAERLPSNKQRILQRQLKR
ncbi:MAG: hypothetical protein GY898_21210 [Proteobacteria bacterium]|nr:hypothetical protein [Pseudomonadota bacterium]